MNLKEHELSSVKDPEGEAIIICLTHREGARIVEAVRNELKDRGLISQDEHELEQLVSC